MLMLMTKTEIAGAMVKMKSWHFEHGAPRPLGVVGFRTRPPGPTKAFGATDSSRDSAGE
jgi:hypothetical protein